MKPILFVLASLLISPLSFAQTDLENAQTFQKVILINTAPGGMDENRLHAKGKPAEVIKKSVPALNSSLLAARLKLAQDLADHRKGDASIPNRLKEVADYNAVIDALAPKSVVYDDDNTFGSFGESLPILSPDVVSAGRIETTPFDFTEGFQVQCKEDWYSGITVHRHRKTGEVLWFKASRSSIAVVAEDYDGNPITKVNYYGAITSIWDPVTDRWKVYEEKGRYSNAAVYNPTTEKVEYVKSEQDQGIGGVFHPITGQVEWETAYETGIAGWYDPGKKRVFWKKNSHGGVACIWRDENGQYHTSTGYPVSFPRR